MRAQHVMSTMTKYEVKFFNMQPLYNKGVPESGLDRSIKKSFSEIDANKGIMHFCNFGFEKGTRHATMYCIIYL